MTHKQPNRHTSLPAPVTDPVASARVARLRYVSDTSPGIRRKRAGKGFSYRRPDGALVHDAETLRRIRSLAIPPAWTEVWICTIPNGHLQATGRDAKGRKQYRYHPRWREARDETKYTRSVAFGEALPHIRARVQRDLKRPDLPREKVLATVVRLLETTLIRVGNEEYAKTNKSYGLTTMRNRHVDVEGARVRFHFRGKSGIDHSIDINDRRLAKIVTRCKELPGAELFQYINDRRLAKIVTRCKELPGAELFQYIDDDGQRQSIDSGDVNAYLHDITGDDFTAKDFRTWAGTMLAAMALQEFEAFDSEAQAKRNIVQAIERVAERLGNTPSVCRKCYVHPAVLDAYMEGAMLEAVKQRAEQEIADALPGLKPEEGAVLAFLQQRLAREMAAR
ncbi:MAG: DNA topoisomerase IB [Thermomicrobiales bacterium]